MSKNKTTFIFRILPGVMLAFAILNAFDQLSNKTLEDYNILIGIALIFFNSWLIIVMHELGHAIFLIFKKMPIRSIYIPFISIHFGNKIKFKISPSLISEGLVIPEIPIIKKESDYKKLNTTYINFLLAGPMASIIFYIIVIFGLLSIQYFYPKLVNYCVTLILLMCIQTFFLLQNCFKEINNNMGDIVAVDRVKNDNFFFASYLYCCYFFSENYKAKIKECIYVKNIIKENLIIMNDDQLIRKSDLLDEIIYRTISGLDNYFNDFLNQKIYSLVDILFDGMINRTQKEYSVVSTYLHALMYIIIICNNSNKALQLYTQAEGLLEYQNPMCKYLHFQIRYLLCLETNKPKEIYPVTEYERWRFYTQYSFCENTIFESKIYE